MSGVHGARRAARCIRVGTATLVALSGCADSTAAPPMPLDLSTALAHGSPTALRVDSMALAAAFVRADTMTGLRSLLVLRDGTIVGERYFGTISADSLHDVRSVTKSIVSLLVGIAIDRGLLSGPSEPLDSLIHPPVASVDAVYAPITVRDLLTMTGGLAWDESTAAGYNAWVLASDQITYVLTRQPRSAVATRLRLSLVAGNSRRAPGRSRGDIAVSSSSWCPISAWSWLAPRRSMPQFRPTTRRPTCSA